jgi:hypothetical protein
MNTKEKTLNKSDKSILKNISQKNYGKIIGFLPLFAAIIIAYFHFRNIFPTSTSGMLDVITWLKSLHLDNDNSYNYDELIIRQRVDGAVARTMIPIDWKKLGFTHEDSVKIFQNILCNVSLEENKALNDRYRREIRM